ncbi:MAG: hypothetical protein KKH67_16145 [candidate division Zixibacteria bacterium]|nr:hypothetical protein [candidate division Zixibacteria bacterium]
MPNVEEVGKAVVAFLQRTHSAREVKVIKVAKVGDGWETDAEAYEDSSFLKSLGLPTKVQDRNVYTIRLGKDLEIESYERMDQPMQTD